MHRTAYPATAGVNNGSGGVSARVHVELKNSVVRRFLATGTSDLVDLHFIIPWRAACYFGELRFELLRSM